MARVQFSSQQFDLGGRPVVLQRIENEEGNDVRADVEGVVKENMRSVNGKNGMTSKQDVSEKSGLSSPYKIYENRRGNIAIDVNNSSSNVKVRYPTREENIGNSGGHEIEDDSINRVTVMIGGFGFDIIL